MLICALLFYLIAKLYKNVITCKCSLLGYFIRIFDWFGIFCKYLVYSAIYME